MILNESRRKCIVNRIKVAGTGLVVLFGYGLRNALLKFKT